MQIQKIILDHIGPIEYEEIEPKQVTIFEGPNGSGKSLHLKAIRAALSVPKRGQDFNGLLGDDAAHGYVSLSLSTSVHIRREIGPAGTQLMVSSKKLGEQKGPQANRWVTQEFDAESINCEQFLTKDPKERTRLILEAIPFELDREGLNAILGEGERYDKIEGHPLEVLDIIRKSIYDHRTEVNRFAKERRTMAEGLAGTIQSEVNIAQVNAEIEEFEAQLEELAQERNEKVERADREATQSVKATTDAFTKSVNEESERHTRVTREKREEIQAKIDALTAELNTFIAAEDKKLADIKAHARQSVDEVRAASSATAEKIRSEAEAEYSDRSSSLRLAIQEARAKRDGEVAAEAQRKIAQDGLREAAAYEEQSRELSNQLDKLDEFKGNMLKELPIPGITMQDGEIIIDNKPWDKVPDSRLVILAIDLGIARSQESSILIVDKAEAIDGRQFEDVIVPHLRKSGRQCFVGRANVGTPEKPITELRVRKLEALT